MTGSALNSLLFMAVAGKQIRVILCKLLYADDLAVVGDTEADLQQHLVEWKEFFGRHGLRIKEDEGALGRVAEQISSYKTGREETETTRELCISGWSDLQGWWHGDGNSQEKMGRMHGGKWKG